MSTGNVLILYGNPAYEEFSTDDSVVLTRDFAWDKIQPWVSGTFVKEQEVSLLQEKSGIFPVADGLGGSRSVHENDT